MTADALKAKFPSAADRPSADHPAVNVPASELVEVLRFLRDEGGYDLLADVSGIDWGVEASPRFSVAYHVLSTGSHEYFRVVADCAKNAEPSMPTVTVLWPAANWHEREAFDMFGIDFAGHPDLKRILMWDGYPHHPLRKDFPLAGIETELPDLEVAAVTKAKVKAAPMDGGPFVAHSGEMNLSDAEPRAKDESWSERR